MGTWPIPYSEKWARSGLQGPSCSTGLDLPPLCARENKELGEEEGCSQHKETAAQEGKGFAQSRAVTHDRGKAPSPLPPAAASALLRPAASQALGAAVPEFQEVPGEPHAPGGPQVVETESPKMRSQARQGGS